MVTKALPKNKYQKIVTSVNDIIEDFKKTGKYSASFLRDLKEGLYDLKASKAWKSK